MSYDAVKYLSDNQSLLDVMISIEDYMDSLDLWAFKNWINGQIVDGPWVKRYWVIITAKYPYEEMPDPQGGLRLLKYGTKVKFEKTFEEVPVDVKDPTQDIDPETKKPKMVKKKIWYVHFKIPRKFIDEHNLNDLSLYDNIGKDDVEQSDADPVTQPETAEPTQAPPPAEDQGTSDELSL
jgi:hypothetical protein